MTESCIIIRHVTVVFAYPLTSCLGSEYFLSALKTDKIHSMQDQGRTRNDPSLSIYDTGSQLNLSATGPLSYYTVGLYNPCE